MVSIPSPDIPATVGCDVGLAVLNSGDTVGCAFDVYISLMILCIHSLVISRLYAWVTAARIQSYILVTQLCPHVVLDTSPMNWMMKVQGYVTLWHVHLQILQTPKWHQT